MPTQTSSSSPVPVSTTTHQSQGGRDRILRVALELFRDRGFADVSMQDIASAAQMTKPALYYHFKDKQELFGRVFASEWEQFNETMADILSERLGLEDTMYRVSFTVLQSGRGELRRMFTDFLTYLDPESRSGIIGRIHPPAEVLLPFFRQLRSDGLVREDIDLELTLPLLFSMIFGQIRKFNAALVSDPSLTIPTNEQIASAITNLMMNGISTSKEANR